MFGHHSQSRLDPALVEAALGPRRLYPESPSTFHDSVASSLSASSTGDDISEEELWDGDDDATERIHTTATLLDCVGTNDPKKSLANSRHSFAAKSEDIVARIRQRHSVAVMRRMTDGSSRSQRSGGSKDHKVENRVEDLVQGMDESSSTRLLILAAQESQRNLQSESDVCCHGKLLSDPMISPRSVARNPRSIGQGSAAISTADSAGRHPSASVVRMSPKPLVSPCSTTNRPRRHTTSECPKPRLSTSSQLGLSRSELKELKAMFADRNA